MATTATYAAVGRRLLADVEETSLDEVLQRIRAAAATRAQQHTSPVTVAAAAAATATLTPGLATSGSTSHRPRRRHRRPPLPLPALEAIVAAHFRATRAPELTVGGTRPLALVYLLVAALVAAPRHQAVVVVDTEARFDVRQLLGVQPVVVVGGGGGGGVAAAAPVAAADLQHVHVVRVDPRWAAPLPAVVAAAEQRVLYGAQRRRDRPWWGTLVVGGGGGGGGGNGPGGGRTITTDDAVDVLDAETHGIGAALVTEYYGWLRVDAEPPPPRTTPHARLQALLDGAVGDKEDGNSNSNSAATVPVTGPITWVARSPWGSFAFRLHKTKEWPAADGGSADDHDDDDGRAAAAS